MPLEYFFINTHLASLLQSAAIYRLQMQASVEQTIDSLFLFIESQSVTMSLRLVQVSADGYSKPWT